MNEEKQNIIKKFSKLLFSARKLKLFAITFLWAIDKKGKLVIRKQ